MGTYELQPLNRSRSTRLLSTALAAVFLSLLVGAAVPLEARGEPRVLFEITPPGTIVTASTFSNGSFKITNQSTAGERIDRILIDLSTAMLPDMIFDPFGTAGDLVAKTFTPNSGAATVGLQSHAFSEPTGGGGYDVLEIFFSDFDPGETFTFAVDVDPHSIKGVAAPGPGDSGSVSGLELVGSIVEAEMGGAGILSGTLYRFGTSLTGSTVTIRPNAPLAPSVQVLGTSVPAQVQNPSQTVRISGTPGAQVALLRLEGALYLAGVPGGGYNVSPFDANSVIAVSEQVAILGPTGIADIPVTLVRSVAEGGIHHLAAVEFDAQGLPGFLSNVAVLELLPSAQIAFVKSVLQGVTSNQNPTSLQFGPDGRLYVARQNGLIRVYTIQRLAADNYQVTAAETISLIQQIPNHNDDGTPNPSETTRQITGILVKGTAANPIIYVGSSDPRIGGGGSGTSLNLDTNSGIISRLTLSGGSWVKEDLVRGLPRSEENHSVNGMQLDEATNTLYATIGGFTNMGAPSNNFAFTPEYALSAAILSIDLDALGPLPYDLPTLDDEDRPGVQDANDPFGGNDGKNQAIIVPGGPVQVYSSGWRNPYDLLLMADGRMYSIDNGPNAGWGAAPIDDGSGNCTNAVREPGVKHPDGLHLITGPGYYAGHPNPTRANPANTFNASNPQSPVSTANPVECQYRAPGPQSGALVTWPSSTNGIAEYRASSFGGQMQGDLLAVSFSNQVQRVRFGATGNQIQLSEALFSSVGSLPLDITTQGDNDIFPGTIWVANYGGSGGAITIFEPETVTFSCTGAYDWLLDEDGDGYSNADEIDNGTNPCDAADVPPDWNNNGLSDLNDPDDDSDGLLDFEDPYALDPQNGLATLLPVVLAWDNDSPNLGGLLNLGFTGLMTNYIDDYAALFDPTNMVAGGAAGVLTVAAVPAGDARFNDQQYAFQVGARVNPGTPPFILHTRVLAPFAGIQPTGTESLGMYFGTGDQDNYLKAVVTPNGVALGLEVNGGDLWTFSAPVALAGAEAVDLYLEIDPASKRATASYRVVAAGGVVGTKTRFGPPVLFPKVWVESGYALALGIIASSGGGVPFAATWEGLEATFVDPNASVAGVIARINSGGPAISGGGGSELPWTTDGTYVSEGTSVYSTTATIAVDSTVPSTTPLALFKTERWDPPGGQEMTYEIPVPANAPLEVRLYFAEIYHRLTGPGQRVFDVDIEGVRVLEDFDIWASVGPYTGTMRSFISSSTDGSLTIEFLHKIENPKISAIEVFVLGAAPECSDGIDNDGDGLIDYPEDPDCLTPFTWKEGKGSSCGLGFELAFLGLLWRRARRWKGREA